MTLKSILTTLLSYYQTFLKRLFLNIQSFKQIRKSRDKGMLKVLR